MLANYLRWIFEKDQLDCIETLRDWIAQDAEFQIIAIEKIKGTISIPKRKN